MSEMNPPARGRRKRTIGEGPAASVAVLTPASPDHTNLVADPREIPASSRATALSGGRDANLKLQISFFIAVAFGLASAISSNAGGFEWLGFAGPLLAIAAFCAFGLSQGFASRSDTRQQFADSCYFLGFLLTMVAMLVGFLPAGLFGQEITSQGILRHFSMALGATALGLVCRIIALQGGRSLGQIAAEVETSLSQYARKVSNEAKIIGGELAVLRQELEGQQQQAGMLVTGTIRDAVHTAFEPLGRSLATISEELGNQSERIAGSAQTLQRALDASSAKLTAVAEVKNEADSAARAAIVGVGESLRRLEAHVEGLRTNLSSVVERSSADIEAMALALSGATALAPELGRAITTAAADVVQASQRFDELTAHANALIDKVDKAFDEDDQALGRIGAAQTAIVDQIGKAGGRARDGIIEEGEATRSALRQAQLDFTQLLESERQQALAAIRSEGQAFSRDIADATERLAAILQNFASRIEEAKK